MSAPVLDRPAEGWADLAHRPLGPSRGWSPLWRMARRDLRRHPGRTAAAAVMILVPVMLAAAFAVFLSTTDVSSREADLARLGSAEALVSTDGTGDRTWTRAQVEARVDVPLVEVLRGDVTVGAGDDQVSTRTLVTDLAAPVTDGLVDVLSGRVPTGTDEVALSPGIAERLGAQVGDRVQVDGAERQVTGSVVERWGDAQALLLVGGPDAVGGTVSPLVTTWLAPSAADLDRTVQGGTEGLMVLDRQEVERAEDPLELGTLGGEFLIVLSVGLALVVLEIALLAGPAFAVGVRQQQRTLALLAATGGDDRALRRVVLAQALAVGVGAAVVGAALGTAGAALAMRLLRYRVGSLVGPVEVPWAVVTGFVLVGVVAAIASAVVPALTASRATVVAGLAPRPTGRRLPWRRPLTGAVLLVAGTLLLRAVTAGLTEATTGAAVSVLLLGVGMVLVVPLAVALLGRLTTRLPLGLRMAGRESTRAAGRSVAAVAAVAGASAGLVAALTLTAAATEADRAAYSPAAAPGVSTAFAEVAAEDVERLARETLPGARTGLVGSDARFDSVEVEGTRTDDSRFAALHLPTPGCGDWDDLDSTCSYDWAAVDGRFGFGGTFESADEVGAQLAGYGLDEQQAQVLADGGMLLAEGSPADTGDGEVEVVAVVRTPLGDVDTLERISLPVATWRPVDDQPAALLGERAARQLGVWLPSRVLVQPAGQVASPPTVDDLDDPAERRAAVDAVAPFTRALEREGSLPAPVSTEVGYTGSFRLVDVVVVVLALVVLLGATFTATALALADARRDRVVMTAVGAPPAAQRSVAGATAALIAGTGALVGGLVGLVPGLLVGHALLRPSVVSYGLGVTDGREWDPGPVLLLVPWGWFALLLLGLPLLAGLVVAAVASGRPDTEVTGPGRPA